jgi:hypothetical protein
MQKRSQNNNLFPKNLKISQSVSYFSGVFPRSSPTSRLSGGQPPPTLSNQNNRQNYQKPLNQ